MRNDKKHDEVAEPSDVASPGNLTRLIEQLRHAKEIDAHKWFYDEDTEDIDDRRDNRRMIDDLEYEMPEEDEDRVGALQTLADLHEEEGEYTEALERINEAIALAPRDTWNCEILGRLFLRAWLPDAATDMFRKAVALDPDNVPAHLGLADSLIRRGWVDSAITTLRRARDRAADNRDVYYALGLALGIVGEADESVEALKKAVELSPDWVEGLRALAQALRRTGRVAEARQARIQYGAAARRHYAARRGEIARVSSAVAAG